MEDERVSSVPRIKRIAQWAALIGGGIFAGTFVIGGAASMLNDPELYRIALQHMPATIGLPSAALAALCLVIVLENTSGPIEFEGLGFKFKGASGPVVLWCLAFLSMAAAIKWLWA
ncbi:hypothetical protein [Chromobacterium violaceum]|uniref:hypothetical protein n=1 Tax=Chromobacterium violaceum TaxID=536 RepID=UPI0009D9377E|nr:hypothetical protein [Chromobacterium violaceum]OQS30427.1 hypothetical protein B0T41_00275 [Chromobacterium violaceum]